VQYAVDQNRCVVDKTLEKLTEQTRLTISIHAAVLGRGQGAAPSFLPAPTFQGPNHESVVTGNQFPKQPSI